MEKTYVLLFNKLNWKYPLLALAFLMASMTGSVAGNELRPVQSIDKISVEVDIRNASLTQVLKLIEPQAGINFMYNEKDVQNVKNITIPKRKAVVSDLLDMVLEKTHLGYKQVDSRVLILPVHSINTSNLAQTIHKMEESPIRPVQTGQISGKIVGNDGVGIQSVTIRLEGPKELSQTTDISGNFAFTGLPAGTYRITVTSVGYERYTESVSLRTESMTARLSISLRELINELTEVLVVAYGRQERSSFTGSVSSLKAEDVASTPRVSIQESFQGNLTGVQASNGSGQPGSVPDVRIRGIGSINAGSRPLYVVDGVPIESFDLTGYGTNTIAGISANDVENITVLKDASSASLYGSRAANGVVLITTKSGNSGRTRLNIGVQQGYNSDALGDRNKPVSTSEMLELLREGWVNAGQSLSTFNDHVISANNIDTTISTNWADELLRTGKFSQYDLSINGGNDITNYYISGGYMRSQAVMIGVDYDRVTSKIKVASKPASWASFDANILFSYQKANTRPDESSFENPFYYLQRMQPWVPVRNEDGTYILQYSSSSSDINPRALAEQSIRRGTTYNVMPGLSAAINLSNDLVFESKGSINLNFAEARNYRPYNFSSSAASGGIGIHRNRRVVSWINTNILRYDKQFGDHGLQLMVGSEAQKTQFTGSEAQATNFLPGATYLDAASNPTTATSSFNSNSIFSLFFNSNYNYLQKYHLSFSLRRDGSSRFYGSQNMYGNFYSVGGAWNIDKEDFIRDLDYISALTLRASYGENGNQDIGDFAAMGLYSRTAYDGAIGLYYSQINNDLLTWEKNRPFNVGLDFGFFRNRFTGAFEYYNRITSDLLYAMPIPSPNGLLTYLENIGEMKNSGIELSLTSRNMVASNPGDFTWSTTLNFTTQENLITKLPTTMIDTYRYREVGLDFYQFHLVGYAGVDPQTGEALWWKDGSMSETITDYSKAARFNQGSAIPKFFGGFNNNFSLKNFELGVNVFFNFGNKIFDNWARYSDTDGNLGVNIRGKMSRQVYDYRWQQPGDDAQLPKIVYLGTQSSTSEMRSTRYLYDGSYVRLRDVTLAYNFPPSALQSMGKLGGLRLYARASNLYTWLKDERLPYDPEVQVTGMLDNKPPVARTVVFGIDVNF